MKLVRKYAVNKYESAMPRYFTAIFLFAATIIFISFLVILKEYRQRSDYQKQLEQKVLEVNAYNVELEQIAFATSHDLQGSCGASGLSATVCCGNTAMR